MHKRDDHRVAALFHIRKFLPWPFRDFIVAEAAGGIVLLIASVIGLIWANNTYFGSYSEVWSGWRPAINEGLMTIFFLVVGLEINREFVKGELRGIRTALLPILAAIGGMIVPALIYLKLNPGFESNQGWAIPISTDIVFASGVLILLGKSVPKSLKLFLLVLAIVDDIGAIVVIGLFYSDPISLLPVSCALSIIAFAMWARKNRNFGISIYIALTVALWYALHLSGIQANIAGVIIGLLAPLGTRKNKKLSVAERLEQLLFPVAMFIVVPLFVLANVGVNIRGISFNDNQAISLALGIFFGLTAGKIIGITSVSMILVKVGLSKLPKGVTWSKMIGTSCVAGIGFTVSLFVADLSFKPDSNLLGVAKLSVLATSVIAAIIGAGLIRRGTKAKI